MIFDKTLQLSDKQVLTATAPSTNVIDLGVRGTAYKHAAPLMRNLGLSDCVPFLVQATADFAGGTSLEVQLQTSDDPAFGASDTVATSGAIPLANLKAGAILMATNYIPSGVAGKGVAKRYMRLNYVVTGAMTGGSVTAGIVAAVQTA